MKYEFTDDFLTGIEFIDKQHARLFELANQTYDLLHDELVTDKYDHIVDVLAELRDYTKTHFADELYRLDASFCEMALERLIDILFLHFAEAELDGVVAIALDRLVLQHEVVAGLHDRNGHNVAVLGEDLSHTKFST